MENFDLKGFAKGKKQQKEQIAVMPSFIHVLVQASKLTGKALKCKLTNAESMPKYAHTLSLVNLVARMKVPKATKSARSLTVCLLSSNKVIRKAAANP